jgi:hypothetical protein
MVESCYRSIHREGDPMSDKNRRDFLKSAVGTSGGLFIAAALSAQPQGTFVFGEQVNPNQLKPGMKPRFSMQAVLATIQGQTVSVIPSAAPVTIYPTSDLIVWKGTESRDFSGLTVWRQLVFDRASRSCREATGQPYMVECC